MLMKKDDSLLDDEVLKYGAFKFKTSDKYLVWKVISRENNEILMKWELGSASGTTWFCIPRDENVLLFGSSFLLPKENYGQKEVLKKEPKQLYIDAARTLEDTPPLVSRIKNALIRTGLSVTLPIHKLYSKYLLLSTHNKIIKEQDGDKRKPQSFYWNNCDNLNYYLLILIVSLLSISHIFRTLLCVFDFVTFLHLTKFTMAAADEVIEKGEIEATKVSYENNIDEE